MIVGTPATATLSCGHQGAGHRKDGQSRDVQSAKYRLDCDQRQFIGMAV